MFDAMATFFASDEAIPKELVPVMTAMTNDMLSKTIDLRTQGKTLGYESRSVPSNSTDQQDNVYHSLDVGCGTGALFDFFLHAAQDQRVVLNIHGLDLAPNMVEQARVHAEALLGKHGNNKHSITVQVGDISHWEPQPPSVSCYDLVVANACFGNFWDPRQALQSMTELVRVRGLVCISHPLGADFVRQLRKEDPITVPHLLPATKHEFQQLARTLPLHVLDVVDKGSNNKSFYMASAVKVVYNTLSQTMRLRGQVDRGYGRGGKKLGFPTANLPSRLFQGALQDVPCGVYFGWAALEKDMTKESKGRNVPHKVVVNVGYSPTFEGQENPEKIVEAHFMFPTNETPLDPPDFYGEVMRLLLIGFLRPEMKFPSFPDLIAQISTDVENAKDALDLELYKNFKMDDLVKHCDTRWVGRGGGDEAASWEFEDVEAAIHKLGSF